MACNLTIEEKRDNAYTGRKHDYSMWMDDRSSIFIADHSRSVVIADINHNMYDVPQRQTQALILPQIVQNPCPPKQRIKIDAKMVIDIVKLIVDIAELFK